jgi:hypothetical protein
MFGRDVDSSNKKGSSGMRTVRGVDMVQNAY